jgi:hypothetical protein
MLKRVPLHAIFWKIQLKDLNQKGLQPGSESAGSFGSLFLYNDFVSD